MGTSHTDSTKMPTVAEMKSLGGREESAPAIIRMKSRSARGGGSHASSLYLRPSRDRAKLCRSIKAGASTLASNHPGPAGDAWVQLDTECAVKTRFR